MKLYIIDNDPNKNTAVNIEEFNQVKANITNLSKRVNSTESSRIVLKGITAPSNPVEGDLFWDDNSNSLKCYTNNSGTYSWNPVSNDPNIEKYLYLSGGSSPKLYKYDNLSDEMIPITGEPDETNKGEECKVRVIDYWSSDTPSNPQEDDIWADTGNSSTNPVIKFYIKNIGSNLSWSTSSSNSSIDSKCIYFHNDATNPTLYKRSSNGTLIKISGATEILQSWSGDGTKAVSKNAIETYVNGRIEEITPGGSATVLQSWSGDGTKAISKNAIEAHYEGTNPKGVITTLNETVAGLQEQVAAIDPNYELDYVPYDWLNGNDGYVNLPLNLDDNYEVGSINLQQVTSGQVRKAYTIKEFDYEEADIYHIIKKGEGSDSPSLTTFRFTSPTEPTEEGNITIDNGDLWLNYSNFEIREAAVTVTTSNNVTTRKINWPLVTKDILTKESGTYYHYVNKTKTEVQSSHVKEFTVVDVETINSISSNNQGSHSANYFDTIKALFDNIKTSIDNEEESDRRDKDKRVVVLKLYDMFWVGKLPTVNSEIDERIFAPCNLRIEGVNDNCGMYIRGILMNTTYSLELENVVFHNYRNDNENYGTIKIYVEDKYVDHVIVRGCTFACSGSGYLMRTIALYSRDRTPFVITTPNVDENDPDTLAKYTGDDGCGGNGFASVNYSQDFTKLRKYNCLGHLLIEKNTVDTCNSFLTSEYKYQNESSGTTTTILYSCRVLDNVFTVRNGTIIGLGSCNQLTSTEPQNANRTYKYKDNNSAIVTMPTATNYSFGRYRAQVSCPVYVVGNTFKGPNQAVVNSGSAYRCAVSGDRGTLYFLNNKVIDLVTVPNYTMVDHQPKSSYYAAYDLYFRGSRLYVVNNEITNLTGFWRNNYNKGTFKSKGNANLPQFANIPNNIVKCYKYNTYKIDINKVKQLWNNLESSVSNDYKNNQLAYIKKELGVQDLSWTWEQYFTAYYKNFVDFSLDAFVDADKNWVSNSISEINFSHNNVDYPYIRGVDTGSGEYPTKRMVLSYNNFKGDFVNGKNWKWTKQNTDTEERISNLPWIYIKNAGWNYCTEPSDWWLFSAVLNTEEIEVVGNKFDTKNSVIGIVRRKYLSGQPSTPIHFTVESNEVDKTSLLYFGKAQSSASLLYISKFSKNYTLNLTSTSYFIHSLDSYNGTIATATGGATAGIGITDYLPINNNILYIKLDNVFIRLLAGDATQTNIQDYFNSLVGGGENKFIAVAVFYDENKNIIKSVSEKDEDYVYSPRHTHYHYTEFADKGATASDELGINNAKLKFSILTIRNENIPTNAKYVRFSYFIGVTGATTVDVEVAYSDYKYYLEALSSELYPDEIEITANYTGHSIDDVAGLCKSEVGTIFKDLNTEEFYECTNSGLPCLARFDIASYASFYDTDTVFTLNEVNSEDELESKRKIAIKTSGGRLIAEGIIRSDDLNEKTYTIGSNNTSDRAKLQKDLVIAFRKDAMGKLGTLRAIYDYPVTKLETSSIIFNAVKGSSSGTTITPDLTTTAFKNLANYEYLNNNVRSWTDSEGRTSQAIISSFVDAHLNDYKNDPTAYYSGISVYVKSLGGLHWHGNRNHNYPKDSLYIDIANLDADVVGYVSPDDRTSPLNFYFKITDSDDGFLNGNDAVWERISLSGIKRKIDETEDVEVNLKKKIKILTDKVGALEQLTTKWQQETQLFTNPPNVCGAYNLWYNANIYYGLGNRENKKNRWMYLKDGHEQGTYDENYFGDLSDLLKKLDKLTTKPSDAAGNAYIEVDSNNVPHVKYYDGNSWKILGTSS